MERLDSLSDEIVGYDGSLQSRARINTDFDIARDSIGETERYCSIDLTPVKIQLDNGQDLWKKVHCSEAARKIFHGGVELKDRLRHG